jgi:hypothetical protein
VALVGLGLAVPQRLVRFPGWNVDNSGGIRQCALSARFHAPFWPAPIFKLQILDIIEEYLALARRQGKVPGRP